MVVLLIVRMCCTVTASSATPIDNNTGTAFNHGCCLSCHGCHKTLRMLDCPGISSLRYAAAHCYISSGQCVNTTSLCMHDQLSSCALLKAMELSNLCNLLPDGLHWLNNLGVRLVVRRLSHQSQEGLRHRFTQALQAVATLHQDHKPSTCQWGLHRLKISIPPNAKLQRKRNQTCYSIEPHELVA